jgi:hypothetical protein
MVLNFALVLYLFLLLLFIVGNMIIVYHLLTFRLNRILGVFMVGLFLTGSVILLGLNLFYFSEVDWRDLFETVGMVYN